MTVQERCHELQFKDVCGTDVFQRRDKSWPFESWDYTEWEECINEIRKEMLTTP